MIETRKKYIAGGYDRLSLNDKDNNDKNNDNKESVSITNQKKIIKDFAEKNGIEIYDFYDDDGYSGGNFDRPGFKRLINDIECGVINCVITKDISRLGRDFIETGNYIYKYFPEHNVRYIAINDSYDSDKPNDLDDMLPFKTVYNDMYLKDISKKIKSTRHNMMRNGEFVSGNVPYGYKRSIENNKKLVIDEYSSKIVERIFKMKSEGMTENMIARALTNDGVLPPALYGGKKIKSTFTTNLWKAGTIKHILSNKVYIGTLIQGKFDRVNLKSKKKKLLPKNQWIIVENNHPAIVSKELFDEVNSKYNNINGNTRHRIYDYLLKGLVICADCNKTMLVRRYKSNAKATIGQKYAIYCCRTYATYRNNICSMHYYREEDLNNLVLKEIRNVLTRYSNKNLLNKEYESTISSYNVLDKYKNDLDINQTKLKDLDKAISDLYKDKSAGIISTDEFISIKNNLEEEKLKVSKLIKDLKILIVKTKNTLIDDKYKEKIIKDFLQVKNPTKEMIERLISKITIDKDKNVKIFFNFNINEGVKI